MRIFYKSIIFSLTLLILTGNLNAQDKNYPIKTVDGKAFYIYQVKSAEGFYSVGHKFNVSQDEIIRYNPATANGLQSGQELLIPVKSDTAKVYSNQYFIHTIEPGETLESIAASYNLSPEKIQKINPEISKELKHGLTLKIPQTGTPENIDFNGNYTYHTIAPGETLFSLSRKYRVNAEDIIKDNPGLNVQSFTSGKVIRINKTLAKTPAPEKVVITITPKQEISYVVKKKETLFSISKKFSVSVQDIAARNPNIGNLKNGDILYIPASATATAVNKDTDNTIQKNEETKINQLLNQAITQSNGRIKKVTLMLPFELDQQGDKLQAAKFIEFYEGLLLAIETLKIQGVSLELSVYDTGNSIQQLNTILEKPELKQTNLIIGPYSPESVKLVAEFAKVNNINMVVPFSSNIEEVIDNPRLFMTNTPHSYLFSEASQEFSKLFGDRQIVFIKDKNEESDKKDFVDALKAELNRKSIKYQEFTFTTSADISAIDSLLPIVKPVVFLPVSSNKSMLNKIITPLRSVAETKPDLSITLFGYPEWQTYTTDYINAFYKLNTYFYSRFYLNNLSTDTKSFYRKYKYWYSKDLIATHPKYGILGYDTGMYFIEALTKYGKNFQNQINKMDYQNLQTDFYFKRINNWSGFINHSIYFVHFRPDFVIEKIEIK